MGEATRRKRTNGKFKGDSYKFKQIDSAQRLLQRMKRERLFNDPVVCEVVARRLGAAK